MSESLFELRARASTKGSETGRETMANFFKDNEARARFLHDEITTTGQRLLTTLSAEGNEERTQAAQ